MRARSARSIRLAQAHSALGQLLFDTGRWDEAMAEVEVLHEDLKEPAAACSDLGIAAVICFHRGEIAAARGHLAAAAPHAERIGNRVIGPLALARSLDREQAGALPEALAALTAGFADNTEELEEIEDLLADAVRLATKTGDAGHRARLSPATPRPWPPDRRSRTGRRTRCIAAACWTTMPPGCSAAAERYGTPAGRCSGQGAGGGRRGVHPRRRP